MRWSHVKLILIWRSTPILPWLSAVTVGLLPATARMAAVPVEQGKPALLWPVYQNELCAAKEIQCTNEASMSDHVCTKQYGCSPQGAEDWASTYCYIPVMP